MARRSRTITDTIKQEFRVWRIAIYIRLSKEDARNNDESESVSNQRAIIEEHIASFNDGDEYIIVDEYVDDGISGTTDDERDDFQRMLGDIKKGRINCVIVKDLARSFRNYSDQGYYLDDWFPRFNVRFSISGARPTYSKIIYGGNIRIKGFRHRVQVPSGT